MWNHKLSPYWFRLISNHIKLQIKLKMLLQMQIALIVHEKKELRNISRRSQ